MDAALLGRSALNAYIKRVSAKKLEVRSTSASASASSTRVLNHDHLTAQIGATVNMCLLNKQDVKGTNEVEPRRGQSFSEGVNHVNQELMKSG